jgi:transposase InsO family protein
MDERMRFVVEYDLDDLSMTGLCAKYSISRKTGYKWLARIQEAALEGFQDRSRAPHHHPNQLPLTIEQAIVAMRQSHPTWGPKKVLRRLQVEEPQKHWPARSTIAELLRRKGLIWPRKRRRRVPPQQQPFASCDGANAIWCVDFKGWFRTGDGQRCDPLTISDAFSRYLIRCQAVDDTSGPCVRPLFEAAFREYGLPRAIRSDNGSPFASRAVAGLSRLSVWWIKLGITPERIDPGKPQQNGRHERMHLTLKRETASPPGATVRSQQRHFDAFRKEYNEQRPHEALEMSTPASRYVPSMRPYPGREPEVMYPQEWPCRMVRVRGEVKFKGRPFFLSEALTGEPVGFEPIEGRYWRAHFGPVPLGIFDEHLHRMLKPAEIKRQGLVVRPAAGKPPSATLQEASQQEQQVLPMSLD